MNVAELVAYTLKHYFPNIPVKRELQDDGSIELPSFFVQQLETNSSLKLGDEQMRKYNFDVVYLVDQHAMPVTKQNEMRERLLSIFDYLLDKDGTPKYKVNSLAFDVQNDDLHMMFFVTARVGKAGDSLFTELTDFEQKEVLK